MTEYDEVNIPGFVKFQLTTEFYTLWVGPDRESVVEYIYDNATILSNKRLQLVGGYYGSGSRMGEIGTVFKSDLYKHRQYTDITGKHIMIKQDNKILYDFYVDGQKFADHLDTFGHDVILDNGVKITLRDLHRFEGYPYEISGVEFTIPNA
jgi:hypothetical protein